MCTIIVALNQVGVAEQADQLVVAPLGPVAGDQRLRLPRPTEGMELHEETAVERHRLAVCSAPVLGDVGDEVTKDQPPVHDLLVKVREIAATGFDYVGISLDGKRETHDDFRRMKGGYDAALNGMRLCRDAGIKVSLFIDPDTRQVAVSRELGAALGDEVGGLLRAEQVVVALGERPGLSSPDALGLYLTHRPRPGLTDADRNCISNVRPEGLGYDVAAARLAYLLDGARRLGRSGVDLKDDSELGVEFRPIIDQTIGKFYWSFNPTIGWSVKGPDAGKGLDGMMFEPAVKLQWELNDKVSAGIEYFGGTGSLKRMAAAAEQSHMIYPTLDFDLGPEWELNVGYGVLASGSGDHNIFKVIFGRRVGW